MDKRRLFELLDQYSDGELSSDDLRAVESFLASSPEGKQWFWDHAYVSTLLRSASQDDAGRSLAELEAPDASGECDADICCDSSQACDDPRERAAGIGVLSQGSVAGSFGGIASVGGMSLTMPRLIGLVVVAMIAGAGLAKWRTVAHVAAEPEAEAFAKPHPVAFLAVANGCEWGVPATGAAWLGGEIQPGQEISLYEGIAEFRLASGVSLSIEGPTSVVMTSSASFALQYGRVTVHVPWTVADFTVMAGACRLSACDAEFGVYAASGEVEVHAFSGSVTAVHSQFMTEREDDLAGNHDFGDRAIDFSEAVVPEGRALTLRSESGVMKVSQWRAADDAKFASKLSMAGELPISASYVDAVLTSSPVAYWRFEQTGERQSSVAGWPCDLHVSGRLHLTSGAGNQVAEFGRPGAECHLLGEVPIDQVSSNGYSVEFWVKPSHTHRCGLVSLLANPRTPDECVAFQVGLLEASHLEDRNGRLRFLHRDPPSRDTTTGTSCLSDSSYSRRRWQHVVAVKDGPEMRLYVDGAFTGSERDESTLASALHLMVGRSLTVDPKFPFIGQLDELAVYDRPLGADEIAAHFQAVKWGPQAPPAVTL